MPVEVTATQTIHHIRGGHYIGVTRTLAWNNLPAWDVTEFVAGAGWVQLGQYPARGEAELVGAALAATRGAS